MEKQVGSGGRDQPAFQPVMLGLERLATAVERPEYRAAHGGQVGQPAALLIGLDVAGPGDRGLSEDGQPYLALEYIDGTPFTSYCDNRHLPMRARLELFHQVLSAVHYAHAHLVIHRDLKPSNILVTEEGRVCLLDFGIAKLFGEGVTKETELTQLSGRALSPEYAAPEQIAGRLGGVSHQTIYTAIYRPTRLEVEYRWPSARWTLGFDAFVEESRTISLGARVPAA